MTEESHAIDKLLRQRMELIGKLSQATAEHHRIVQMNSGIDVLLMKHPESADVIRDRSDAEKNLAASRSTIESLESSLAVVDRNIESIMNTEV